MSPWLAILGIIAVGVPLGLVAATWLIGTLITCANNVIRGGKDD